VAARFLSGRLGRRREGRLPSLGQDYQQAHREYVERLGPEGEEWLRRKPFSAPPTFELAACLRTFAHVVEQLGLGVRAQILDVGCGPGWLSEYLARCGYWVTGIDVSEDMVRIARERVGRVGPVWLGLEPLAEFHALPALEIPWRDRFDAIVLYDALHHLEDERRTLEVLHDALVPGGRIYVQEGVRPEPGSEGEQTLIAEMEEYGTLESPFDPEYLAGMLEQAGFESITRFAPVDDLFDVADPRGALDDLKRRIAQPETNTFLARRPIPDELAGDDNAFRARIERAGGWSRQPAGRGSTVRLTITNAGRSFWPAGGAAPYQPGTVNIGPYFDRPEGRAELPRTPLPHSLAPGASVSVDVTVPADLPGGDEVKVDLVREGIAWFGDLGSPPLALPPPE
jgi:SAM-dependent methyltransferase